MLMFLSILTAGIAVTLACAALLSSLEPKRTAPPEIELAVSPPRFFGGDVAPAPDPSRLPIEVVLSQIERHVRLEQAAANVFLEQATPESLHAPTASPFVN